MRLLLDANLSPRLLEPLSAAGYDVRHVADLGLLRATDSAIFDRAVTDGFVIGLHRAHTTSSAIEL